MAFFPSFPGKMISGLLLLSGRHFVLALLLPALISSLDDDGKKLHLCSNVQGDPNQDLTFVFAITLKIHISDPI